MQAKKFATGPCWGSPETDAIRTIGPTIRIVGLMSLSSSCHPMVVSWSSTGAWMVTALSWAELHTSRWSHTVGRWVTPQWPGGQRLNFDSHRIPSISSVKSSDSPWWKPTEIHRKSFRNCLFQDQWQLSEAFLRHAFHLLVTLTQECWIPPLLQHSYSWSQ